MGNLREVFQDNIEYPLEEAAGGEIDDRFYKRLVLYHEVIHYQQFVSTNFGLDYARTLNIAMNHIDKGKPWSLPIFREIGAWEKIDPQSLDRFASFLWLRTELEDSFYEKEASSSFSASLYSVPYISPIYLFGQPPTFENVRRMADASDLPISGMPYLRINKGDGTERHSRINVASLMEAYAHLSEIHHILNAYPEIQRDPEKLIAITFNYDPTYINIVVLYFVIFDYGLHLWLHQLSALIDIALMYSPGVVHGIGPMHSKKSGGEKFRLWSNTFIDALVAGKRVTQMRDYSAQEAQRFQDDVADCMGIPRVSALTDMGLEVLAKYGFNDMADAEGILDQKSPLIRRIMAHHFIGLDYRKRYGAGYGSFMFHTPTVQDFMAHSAEIATFYDIESGVPYNFDPAKIFQSSASSIVRSALVSDKTVCPLKMGVPFRCPNPSSDDNLLCKFGRYDKDRTMLFDEEFFVSECWVDVFDRFAQVKLKENAETPWKTALLRVIEAWRRG